MGLSDPTIQSAIITVAPPTIIATAFILAAILWLRTDINRLTNSVDDIGQRVAGVEATTKLKVGGSP